MKNDAETNAKRRAQIYLISENLALRSRKDPLDPKSLFDRFNYVGSTEKAAVYNAWTIWWHHGNPAGALDFANCDANAVRELPNEMIRSVQARITSLVLPKLLNENTLPHWLPELKALWQLEIPDYLSSTIRLEKLRPDGPYQIKIRGSSLIEVHVSEQAEILCRETSKCIRVRFYDQSGHLLDTETAIGFVYYAAKLEPNYESDISHTNIEDGMKMPTASLSVEDMIGREEDVAEDGKDDRTAKDRLTAMKKAVLLAMMDPNTRRFLHLLPEDSPAVHAAEACDPALKIALDPKNLTMGRIAVSNNNETPLNVAASVDPDSAKEHGRILLSAYAKGLLSGAELEGLILEPSWLQGTLQVEYLIADIQRILQRKSAQLAGPSTQNSASIMSKAPSSTPMQTHFDKWHQVLDSALAATTSNDFPVNEAGVIASLTRISQAIKNYFRPQASQSQRNAELQAIRHDMATIEKLIRTKSDQEKSVEKVPGSHGHAAGSH